MRPGRDCGSRESGIALYSVLIAMVVIGASVTSLVQLGRRVPIESKLDQARAAALMAAEGGVEIARAALVHDADFVAERANIGDAEVDVRVEALSADEEGRARWSVLSIARMRPSGAQGLPVQHAVRVELIAGAGLPAIARWLVASRG